MVQLVVARYHEQNKERKIELETCFSLNLKNEIFTRIILLCEKGIDYPQTDRLAVIKLNKRPSFNDYFQIANSYEAEFTVIANSDIFFDNTLNLIKNMYANQCYALSRWDVLANGATKHHDTPDSQDCWIFKRRIRNIRGGFYPGIAGCDNRLAYEIHSVGYDITNPSQTIRAYHLHKTNIRHYNPNNRVPKPYRLLHSCKL